MSITIKGRCHSCDRSGTINSASLCQKCTNPIHRKKVAKYRLLVHLFWLLAFGCYGFVCFHSAGIGIITAVLIAALFSLVSVGLVFGVS